MVRFEGDKDFPQEPDELWSKLTDAHFLALCIPDVESMSNVETDRAVWCCVPVSRSCVALWT